MEGPPEPKQRGGEAAEPEQYEPPRLTRLGTLSELTQGDDTQRHSDATFPGSNFL